MKKRLILALGILTLGLSPIAAQADKVITERELPATARNFAKRHFANKQPSFYKLDSDLMSKSYEIVYSDGTKVEFDSKGQWKEVSVRGGAVPAAIVPAQITKAVRTQFPNQKIYQIEKKRRGYEVKLSSGLEVNFDSKYQIVKIDD